MSIDLIQRGEINMNTHLAIICALPTVLFILGSLLLYLDSQFPIPEDKTIRNVGKLFMAGAIAIVLQSLYSIYFG